MSRTKNIKSEEIGDKGIIILNRPEELNALTNEMVHEISSKITQWHETKSMILIKSANEKAFCAGYVFRNLVSKPQLTSDFFKTTYEMNYLIGNLKIPYVALIDGLTMSGGAGLSVHGKYRVATEKTVFAMPETNIGHFIDGGCSSFLSRLPNKLGFYLGLTGSQVHGQDVWHAGIATHYCESAKLYDLERDLLSTQNADEIDSVLDHYCIKPNSEFSLSKQVDLINKAFDAQTVEEILSNLERDNSEWAKGTIQTLRTLSPLSLKISLLELNVALGQPFDRCFQMEYRLALNHADCNDLKEGVKMIMSSKKRKPKWDPARIEDCTDDQVRAYFQKPSNADHLRLE